MTERPATRDRLRADIAAVLDLPAGRIGDDDVLMDLGLDSMRAMTLALQWDEAGVPLDFADLAEAPTLAALWAAAAARSEDGAA